MVRSKVTEETPPFHNNVHNDQSSPARSLHPHYCRDPVPGFSDVHFLSQAVFWGEAFSFLQLCRHWLVWQVHISQGVPLEHGNMGSLLHCPMQRCEADHCPETTFVVWGGTSQLLITPFSVVTHQKLLWMFRTRPPWGCSKAWGSPVVSWGLCWGTRHWRDKSGCADVFMQPGFYTTASWLHHHPCAKARWTGSKWWPRGMPKNPTHNHCIWRCHTTVC